MIEASRIAEFLLEIEQLSHCARQASELPTRWIAYAIGCEEAYADIDDDEVRAYVRGVVEMSRRCSAMLREVLAIEPPECISGANGLR